MIRGLNNSPMKKAERAGVVQPEEEKVLGKHYCSLSILKRGLKKIGKKILVGPTAIRQGLVVLN